MLTPKGALVANSASLGFHWIYDSSYIKKVAQKESIIFKPQNQKHHENAKEAYLGYEGLPVGTLSMQGQVLTWLYKKIKNNSEFNQDDYKALIISKMQPGGKYQGYVESYANKLIASNILNRFNINVPTYPKNDDHLIGLMPYLAAKALGKSNTFAFSLTKLFSENDDYYKLYEMFDYIFDAIKSGKCLKESIEKSIVYSPKRIRDILQAGVQTKDTETFVKKYRLAACSIYEAIPIVLHLAYHAKSFEEAVYENMLIGGNLSDRGALLGAILAEVFPIDDKWEKLAKISDKLSID